MMVTGRARGVRGGLLALLGLTLLTSDPARANPSTHQASSCARPALWVVGDADTVIFLFGTIHTHDGRAHWFDHAVRRAFDSSGELVLETIVPPLPPRSPGIGQSSAAATATIRTARTLGMTVELGADRVLQRAADAAGKPVIGLESFAEQLRMYRALPSPAQLSTPAAAVATTPSATELEPFLQAMMASWNKGDPALIAAVVETVRTQSPDAHRRLFAERNEAWAGWVERRLERPGTVFVAVGTGHLVGNDSLQQKLLARGVRSARVN